MSEDRVVHHLGHACTQRLTEKEDVHKPHLVKLRVQLPETGWTPPTVFSFNVPCICGRHSVRVTKQSSTITTTITWDVNVCALRTPAAPWERLVANGSPPSLRHGTACATLKPDARSVVCVFGGVDPAAPLGGAMGVCCVAQPTPHSTDGSRSPL